MKFRVYFEDTDAMGIVYHANYLRFCERARSEAFFRAGRSEWLSGAAGFVLSEIRAKYHAPARLGDEIIVSTRLERLARASCDIAQEIRHATSGALLFSAWLRLVGVDANGGVQAFSAPLREFLQTLGE